MLHGRSRRRAGSSARRLFRYRLRPRHERIDLHGAGDRLDAGGFVRAVTGGYCALTGPLHGGAPEPVLEMLDAIGTREKIKPWIDARWRGERLMGFGHRVYRVRDPRADVLKGAIERLGLGVGRIAVCRRGRGLLRSALRKRTRSGRWTPTWSSSPQSCSTRWKSRARLSPRSSRRLAPPAGPRMHASSSARAVDPAEFGLYREGAGATDALKTGATKQLLRPGQGRDPLPQMFVVRVCCRSSLRKNSILVGVYRYSRSRGRRRRRKEATRRLPPSSDNCTP